MTKTVTYNPHVSMKTLEIHARGGDKIFLVYMKGGRERLSQISNPAFAYDIRAFYASLGYEIVGFRVHERWN